MRLLRLIRVRLTLWYVLLLAITLAIFCIGVYIAMRRSLYTNLDDSLESRAELVEGLVTEDGTLDASGVQIPGDELEGEEFARVFDPSGEIVFDNSAERFPPPIDSATVNAALAGESSRRKVDANGPKLRVLTAPVRTENRIVGVVEIGLVDEVPETLRILLITIAVGYPFALIVASGGGVFLAGRALSPIDRLTRVARRISAEDLSRRLDLDLPDDELGRLARTFDEMIARLDAAFQRQRQFTADASHELRTPLTAIKGQTEVALQRERDVATYRDVLRAVNSEVDRMMRLVGSLLMLARADSRQIPLAKEEIRLDAVVSDAVEQIRSSANSSNIAIHLHNGRDVRVTADQDLLLQLLLNLLDNAVKYTPSGGAIEVFCTSSGDQVEVAVTDTGPGIPPEHLPHIFERFYRVDQARSNSAGSAGLGLSISKWIAEAHGGSIHAHSAPGEGSRFTVRLPAS